MSVVDDAVLAAIPRVWLRRHAARAALYVTVAYLTLTTTDVYVGGVPLKLFLVGGTLIGWLATERPSVRAALGSYLFAIPVLVGGLIVPIAWFAVSLLLRHQHDPAQKGDISYGLQEASRFVYLLLYFPILAEVRRRAVTASPGPDRGLRIHGVWLWPTLALCAITLTFYAGYALLGLHYGGNVGPFQGRITVESTGTFRAYLIDDVVLIPALALLLGSASARRLGPTGVITAFALLATTFLSHTRGIWLGVMIAAIVLLLLTSSRLSRLRNTRVLAWALCFLFAAAFIVNADPRVSGQAALLVTQRHELSTSYRLTQAPQLLHGFQRHPLLGNGVGAVLPSGYRRDKAEPWSFELSYLQLLFQLGAIGLLLALAAPVWAAYRGIRACARASGERRLALAAAVGGVLGFLLTSGSNPYLVTSVGMLTLAVLLAMVESAMADRSVFDEDGGARSNLLSSVNKRLVKALATVTARRPSSATYIAVLIAILGVAEFSRTRRGTRPEAQPSQTHVRSSAVTAKVRVMRLPQGYAADRAESLVIAGQTGDSTLWGVNASRSGLRISPWRMKQSRLVRGSPTFAGPSPRGRAVRYDVIDFSAAHARVLAVMSELGSRVRVEFRDIAHGGRVLLAATTPPMPLAPGEHRDLALATWAGREPDLIVTDRSATLPRMQVHVLSSTSRFHSALLNVVVPRGPFPVGDFALLAGAVGSSPADLVLVSRRSTRTAHTEVHVLLGTHAYQAFGQQSPVHLPDDMPLETTFLLGRETGIPQLYAIDRRSGILRIVPLAG